MAEELGSAVFTVKGSDSGVSNMLSRLEGQASKVGKSLTDMEGKSVRSFGMLGKAAKAAGMAVQTGLAYATMGIAALITGMIALSGYSLKLAGDQAEVGSKFDVVFGSEAEKAKENLDKFAASANRSKYELREMAAAIQDTFVPLGFARGTARELSEAVTQLAVDLGSFHNMADTEALEALQSALIGNHETVRKFGVIITEVTLNEKLMAMGIKGGTDAASEQQKALARLKLIMEGTSDAQGDAERTADSFANQTKGLWGAVKDLATELGATLIPSAKILVGFLQEGVSWLQANSAAVTQWGETLAEWTQYGVDMIKLFFSVFQNMDLTWETASLAVEEFFVGMLDRAEWAASNSWIAIKWFFSTLIEFATTVASNYIQLWMNVYENFGQIWESMWTIIKSGGTEGFEDLAMNIATAMTKGMKTATMKGPEFEAFQGTDYSKQWEENQKKWNERMEGMKEVAKKTGDEVKKELDFDKLMKEGAGKKQTKIKAEINGMEEFFRKNLLAKFQPDEGKKQTALQAKIVANGDKQVGLLEKVVENGGGIKVGA